MTGQRIVLRSSLAQSVIDRVSDIHAMLAPLHCPNLGNHFAFGVGDGFAPKLPEPPDLRVLSCVAPLGRSCLRAASPTDDLVFAGLGVDLPMSSPV